jgi:hypothetical protein
MREVDGVRREFNELEDQVFADLTYAEDNMEYTLTVSAMTENVELENESWTIAIVAERGFGESSSEPIVSTFLFSIKNVCRDLPWQIPVSEEEEITYNVYDMQEVKLESGLHLDDDFPTDWNEYCDISYVVHYEDGDLTESLYQYETEIAMYEYDAENNMFTGQIKSRYWIGTQTVIIRASVGTDGVYGTYDSVPIYLTMEEPCLSTELVTPGNYYSTFTEYWMTGIQDSRQTVGSLSRVYFMYEEFPDTYAAALDDQEYRFSLCGPRYHYLTVANSEGVQDGTQYYNQYDFAKPYIFFKQYA